MQIIKHFYKNSRSISYVFTLGLILFSIGIIWSPALLSVAVMILGLLILFRYDDRKSKNSWNHSLFKQIELVLNDPYLLCYILFFGSCLFSGLWSESLKEWYWFSRMLLPFLILPIAFFIHSNLSRAQWYLIGSVFVFSVWVYSCAICFDYFSHFESYNLDLLKGKPIVQKISHIRFSMLIAINAVLCFHIYVKSAVYRYRFEKYLALVLFIYFFIFIHLISVKTGIAGLYLALSYYLYRELKNSNRWHSIFMILGIVSLIAMAFVFIPSLQNKLSYSIWQIGEWTRGKWILYSDLERLVSMQIGWELIKHDPFFGSGIGDLYLATKNTYLECFGFEIGKLPHNQFLFSWAFTGIFGLIPLLGIIYYSILQKSWRSEILVMSVQLIFIFSFLFEYTLGTQMGCGMFVFISLVCWKFSRSAPFQNEIAIENKNGTQKSH